MEALLVNDYTAYAFETLKVFSLVYLSFVFVKRFVVQNLVDCVIEECKWRIRESFRKLLIEVLRTLTSAEWECLAKSGLLTGRKMFVGAPKPVAYSTPSTFSPPTSEVEDDTVTPIVSKTSEMEKLFVKTFNETMSKLNNAADDDLLNEMLTTYIYVILQQEEDESDTSDDSDKGESDKGESDNEDKVVDGKESEWDACEWGKEDTDTENNND